MPQRLDKAHVIHLENGHLRETSRQDVHDLFDNLAASPNRERLLIHFHGGLVSRNSALKTIEGTLKQRHLDAGAYPVFFVWESGLLETIENNLDEIVKEKFFRLLLRKVLAFAHAKLAQGPGARAAGSISVDEMLLSRQWRKFEAGEEPYADLDASGLPADATLSLKEQDSFVRSLEDDAEFTNEVSRIARGLEEAGSSRGAAALPALKTQLSPLILHEIRCETSEPRAARAVGIPTGFLFRASKVLYRVIRRFTSHRDHGLYCTAVEEIVRELFVAGGLAKLVWDTMKKDTLDAFEPDPSRFGGTAALQEIGSRWNAGHKPRIILVGHSTGAIFICHWLRYAAATLPADMLFDVVFLAPACHFGLFAEVVRHYSQRIRHIRIFGMQDQLEKDDKVLGAAFPRSLLYLVSGMVEAEADEPLSGMQRYYSGQAPYDAVSFPDIDASVGFLRQHRNPLIWSVSKAGDGLNSESRRHQDFDDVDGPTLDSLRDIIKTGF